MLTVALTAEEEAKLLAQAKARGVSPDILVRNCVKELLDKTDRPSESFKISGAEFDKVLEEIADMIPEGIPPLSDEALRRDSAYTREDEWNGR